jgi:hypothetical protein
VTINRDPNQDLFANALRAAPEQPSPPPTSDSRDTPRSCLIVLVTALMAARCLTHPAPEERRALMASYFQDARLPQQCVVEVVAFPAVLVPSAPASVAIGGVDEFLAAARSERGSRLEPLVRDAGALLLEGSRRGRRRTSTAPSTPSGTRSCRTSAAPRHGPMWWGGCSPPTSSRPTRRSPSTTRWPR